MIEHGGYTGVFEYDPELEIFAGHVIDIRGEIYFEGQSVEELKVSMQETVDHYLEVCEKRDIEPVRPFSGELRLRMGTELHRNVAIAASTEGVSLNTFIAETLRERVG